MNMNKNKHKRIMPIWVKLSLIIFCLSTVVYLFAVKNTKIADFINNTVSVWLRIALSYITYPFPFSVFELLIILLPIIILLLVLMFIRGAGTFASRARVILSLLGAVSLIFTSYIFTLGIGYRTTPMAEKIGLEDSSDITAEQLYKQAKGIFFWKS